MVCASDSMKKAMYFDFYGERKFIVDYLYEQHGWVPVYISGHVDDSLAEMLEQEKFGDCVLQDGIDLRQAQFDYSEIGPMIPVDAEVLEALSGSELSFMGFMDDASGWEFSFEERKRFYFDMLNYWNTVIQRLQPDMLVTFTWPHNQSCYSLYLLCKHYYNIDVIFLDPVPMFDQGYHLVGNSLERLYAPFIDLYNSEEPLEAGEDVLRYLQKVRSKAAEIPKHISVVYQRDKRVKFQLLKQLVMHTIKGSLFSKQGIDWKKNRAPYYSFDSIMNNLEYIMFANRMRRKNIRLRKIYARHCSDVDLHAKFIYFAAPYQPEAVTATNAGYFDDLFLALDILSAAIPDDWVIYYKEHPATFLEGFKGSLRRDVAYYDRVCAYKNVKLVSWQTSTFDLIDHARAVSTSSGTVGWEAVVRGKPSISFGSAWYHGCRSVFSVRTLADCQAAVNRILQGFVPSQDDIERYAAAIERVAVKGMIHSRFDERIANCPDKQQELEKIANALINGYQSLYGKRDYAPLNGHVVVHDMLSEEAREIDKV